MTVHRELAAERWATMTIAEQLGNVGSEVGRAIRARAAGNEARFQPAFERALDLLDLTLADPRWRGPRLKEIARAREVVCDHLAGDGVYGSTDASLERWFMAYALAARRDR